MDPQPTNISGTVSTKVFINVSDPRLIELIDNYNIVTYMGIRDANGNLLKLTQYIVQSKTDLTQSDTVTFDSRGRYSSIYSSSGEKAQFVYSNADSASINYITEEDSIYTFNLQSTVKGTSNTANKTKAFFETATYNSLCRIKVIKKFPSGKEEDIDDANVSAVFYGPSNNTVKVQAGNSGSGTYLIPIPVDFAVKDPAQIKALIQNIEDDLEILCSQTDGGNSFAKEFERDCNSLQKLIPTKAGTLICKLTNVLNYACKFNGSVLNDAKLFKDLVNEFYQARDGRIFVTCSHPLEGVKIIPSILLNDVRTRLDQTGYDGKVIYDYNLVGTWREESTNTGTKPYYLHVVINADHTADFTDELDGTKFSGSWTQQDLNISLHSAYYDWTGVMIFNKNVQGTKYIKGFTPPIPWPFTMTRQ